MECSDVQEKLSAYVDGMVSSEEKMFIDEHLKVCQKCNDSLAALKKTLQYVRDLEEVEPPPWLVQKVMARVREEAEQRRGMLAWLFYPLHIKLPIEAIAVILIAITTVYVFRTVQPEMKLAKAPLEEVRTRTYSEEKEKAPVIGRGKPEPAKPREQFMAAEEREIPREKYREPSRAPSRVAKREKAMPSAGVVSKDESQPTAVSPELRLARVEGKKEGIRLALTVEEIEAATKELERAFVELEGRIINREHAEGRSLIVAELDSRKMHELMERLKLLGEIEEKPATLEAREGDVEIWIEIFGKP
jgi:anti-sigma factor RsiW